MASVSEQITEIWAGNLSDGSLAVLLLNRASFENVVTVYWKDLYLNSSRVLVRDLWKKKNIGVFNDSYNITLNWHESQFLKVVGYDGPDIDPSPKPEPEPEPEEESNNLVLIISIIIGSIIILAIIILIVFFLRKKGSRKSIHTENVNSSNLLRETQNSDD